MREPTHQELAEQAQPLSDGPKLEVGIDEMDLPPAELVDELDNQAPGNVEAPVELEVATLDFFGDELPTWTHPLAYPFRWEGVPYKEIVVSQLSVAQVGGIFQRARAAKRMPDLMEVYAEMTGLPAKVLRALPSVDGDPVTEKCWDFLPPLYRPRIVRHRSEAYAAKAAGGSCAVRMAAGGRKPCRSISHVSL